MRKSSCPAFTWSPTLTCKDTIAPEAAQPPKHARSLLWLAIPIGLVGLAGIALAIWLISTP